MTLAHLPEDARVTPGTILWRMTDVSPQAPTCDLKNLVAWQVAMDLATSVYKATRHFPEDEVFGLRMQVRRAAVSVASNVAEGHGRTSRRDYARFILIARGSLKEAETQLLICQRLGLLNATQTDELLALASRLNRLITGLLKRLRTPG